MNKVLEVIIADIVTAVTTIEVEDLTMPMGFLLWFVILAFPLTRVDRRDWTSAATYVLFSMAAGVTLIFALPQAFTQPIGMQTQVGVTLAMAFIAGVRWSVRWDVVFRRENRVQKSFDKEDEEFVRRSTTDSPANAKRARQNRS